VQAALGHRSVQSAIPYVHLAEDAVAQAQGSRAVRGTLVAQIRTDGRLAGVLQRQAASARHDDLVICPHCGNQLTQRTLRQITKARKSIRRRPGRVT
jgi:hypothetical protein